MDKDNKILISRGEVIGIGRIKVPKKMFKREIPRLSFIVIKENEESFVSTCIHFHIDGYGLNLESSVDDMETKIKFFLKKNFEELDKKSAWNNLRNLSHSSAWANDLWSAYHDVEFGLAEEGEATDTLDDLIERIYELESKTKNLEAIKSSLEKGMSELESKNIDLKKELDSEKKKPTKNKFMLVYVPYDSNKLSIGRRHNV
jgi:hypothetical protein